MSPRRGRVVDERVVHPFPHLMGHNRSVLDARAEHACGIEVDWRIGLDRRSAISSSRFLSSGHRYLGSQHRSWVLNLVYNKKTRACFCPVKSTVRSFCLSLMRSKLTRILRALVAATWISLLGLNPLCVSQVFLRAAARSSRRAP
jgi:hypothetical protein